MKMGVKTQGFKELKAMFKALPPNVANQVLATGVIAGARVIAKAARKAAPRHKDKQSEASKQYGALNKNIKAKALRKRYKNKRAAVVTRGQSFWGDIINRGSRYIPATRWYDHIFSATVAEAQRVQKQYMVAKITQVSIKAVQQYGANKQ